MISGVTLDGYAKLLSLVHIHLLDIHNAHKKTVKIIMTANNDDQMNTQMIISTILL